MKSNVYKYVLTLSLALLVVLVYSYRFFYPPEPYFDEVHYVHFIRELLAGRFAQYSTAHPPLWCLLTALVVRVLGDHSIAWRLVSLISGFFILIAMYFLTKKITGSTQIALLAVFFMVFDCISMTQARIGMMNSLLLVFMLLSLLYFLNATDDGRGKGDRFLQLSGVFLGLAASTKLVALTLGLFFAPVLLYKIFHRKEFPPRSLFKFGFFLMVVPVIIFFCAHLFIPFLQGHTWADIWEVQVFNWHYHLSTTQTHPYVSDWWTWPLMLRPIWFFFETQYAATYLGIICIGNPVGFWVIPLAMGYVLWCFLKRKSYGSGFILLGFFTQWLPYAFIGRFKFFHYFYNAAPFVAMALAVLIHDAWQKGTAGKIFATLYLALFAGMFVYWYPLLTGFPVSSDFYINHMWFSSWI